MKKIYLLIFLSAALSLSAQEYADFTMLGPQEGTGTFVNALLPDFIWNITGAVNNCSILGNELVDDGNAFESNFGQADNKENLYIQNYPNGDSTIGTPVLSRSVMILKFNSPTPVSGWGFCLVDIDVENVVISAVDQFGNQVPVSSINNWLIELFDANLTEDGINIPKWDSVHAALLGSDTPAGYVSYSDTVIGGMASSEAPAAFFMPDIALDSLIIVFENLQDTYFTSYHFFIASMSMSDIQNHSNPLVRLYPNPVKNALQIDLSNHFSLNKAYSLNIFNSNGSLVSKTIISSGHFTIDMSDYPRGLYFIEIKNENFRHIEKINVIH